MAKVILFVLMCATLIGLGSCASIFWNNTFSSGSWTDGSRWQNGTAPGSGDCVYINNPGVTITVPGGVTAGNVTFNSGATLVVSGGLFTINGVLALRGGVSWRVDTGASVNINAHLEIGSNGISFTFYGTVTAAALKTTVNYGVNGIPNNGPSSVMLTGTGVAHVIDSSFVINAGNFIFSPSVTHNFYISSATGPSNTLTFQYTPTLTAFSSINTYYNPFPVNFVFLQGANFLSATPITNTNSSGIVPTTVFQGTFTLSSTTTTINAVPTFQGSVVVVNGGTLTFTNVDPVFGQGASQTLLGTGGVSFLSTDSNGRTATFSNAVNVYFPTFSFSRTGSPIPPNWIFAGQSLTINTPYSISTIITVGNTLTFLFPVTINTGGHLRGGGSITFWDSLTNNAGSQAYTFTPTFKCNGQYFNLTGTGTYSLLGGAVINGCQLNTLTNNQVTLSSAITVTGNSTINLAQINLNFTNTFNYFFAGSGAPMNALYYSLTIVSPIQNIPINFTFTANNVDVVINSTLALIFGTNLVGTGQFSLNNGLTLGDNNQISALVALPSGAYTIGQTTTQALTTTWGGNLLLKNTILSGTGLINFSGTLFILNGLNYINTNSFNINAGITVQYVANTTGQITFVENPTLIFNAGSNRNLGNGITAATKVTVVINDPITFTTTLALTSTASSAAIVFNQVPNQVITLSGMVTDQYTVNGNTIFNATTTRFSGNGIVNINGNVTTNGAINNPSLANDATIILSPTFIVALQNTIFGPTVLPTGGFSTDDSDRNSSTAITSITFNYTATLLPLTGTLYNFLSNVTFLGPVFLKTATPVNFNGPVGFLTFSGNCILIQTNVNFNIRTVFSAAINISDNSPTTGFTVTVFAASQPQNNNDGLWLAGNLFLNQGITLTFASQVNIYFLNSLTIFGTGTFTTVSNTLIGTNAAVTISPLVLNMNGGTTNPTTFLGSGATTYTLAPFSSNSFFSTVFVANVPVTYTGAAITLTGSTTIPTTVSFTNSTVTFMGPGPLIFSGTRTLGSTNAFVFNNVASVTFQNTVNINNALPFTSTGTTATTITFLYDVNLGTAVTIPLSVTFGQNTFSSETVSGNTLTLTGPTIIVNGNINILSSIVSAQVVSGNIQTITGSSASFSSAWSFNVGVCFAGTFNFTSPISFTASHVLKAGASLTFPGGLSFSGSGALSGTGQLCLFNYLNNTINTPITLSATIAITTAGSPFLITGNFFINGTYTCRGVVNFANSITFGYNSQVGLGNSQPINFNDNCQWNAVTPPTPITIVRSTLNVNFLTTINVPLVLSCANTSQTSFAGASAANLFLNGDITVSAPAVALNQASLGPINIITTYNLAMITGVNPTNVLTFNSIGNAEPIVSFSPAPLSQPVNLLAPVRFDNLALGANSAIYSTNGNGRADLGVGITISSTVIVSVPVNLFVTTNTTATQPYLVTLTAARTTFSLSPSLNSPFGYPAPSITFSTAANSIIKFTPNTTLTFNNININGAGTVRFSTGTVNALGTLQVNSGATLWQDLSTITAYNATVVSAPSSNSQPGFYQITFASATPPTLSAQYAVYGGSGIVYLSNFAPSSPVTATVVTVANAAFGNVLSPITGTPGYSYSAARVGNGLSITITPNPGPIPIPTQSNGPAPPVSSAPSQFFSYFVLLIAFLIVFIC